MLAGVPFPFTLRFDPSAVDQQVQRAAIASIGQAHLQLLLGHTKMDSTVRYLGVDIEDALTLSEGIDL